MSDDYCCTICGTPLDVWEHEEGLRTGVFVCSLCVPNPEEVGEGYGLQGERDEDY